MKTGLTKKTEGHRALFQCQGPCGRGLHPRYEAEAAIVGICSEISGAVSANRG